MISTGNRSSAVPTRTIIRAVLVVLGIALTLYLAYLLRRPIGWIVVAGFIAIALTGPVNALARHMRRGFAIALVYLTTLTVPFLIGAVIIPPLLAEGAQLAENVPAYAADVQAFVENNETLRGLDADYQLADRLQERAQELPAQLGGAAEVLGGVGLGLVNSIFALVTIVILSIFMVSSGPAWARALVRLQPQERAVRIDRVLQAMGAAVGNYVAGAIVQAVVAGVLSFAVLTLLGMPFALPLAVLVLLFDLIPLVGATIAAVLVGIVTLFDNFPTTTIVWGIWSIVYQQVENTLIQPQIQKRAVAVHPFVVLVAVLFGSTLFGILGALLAIPVAASAQIALKEWWAWREVTTRQAAAAGSSSTTVTGPVVATIPAPAPPRSNDSS
jgi:predicted PurR-regulated permease PerM